MTAGTSPALTHAESLLKKHGFSFTNAPCPAVTFLLLPVPSFEVNGSIKGGGSLEDLLHTLPQTVTIIGGNLEHPLLSGYRRIDLLKDHQYLACNAQITAYCAITLAAGKLRCTLADASCLVIGWGRIGKCLVQILRGMGGKVTAAARKETDRATLSSLGISTVNTTQIDPGAYDVIFNTAPQMILPNCQGSALKIDLASKPGIECDDVIWARGLPGKDAPLSSGKLIAETITRKVDAV